MGYRIETDYVQLKLKPEYTHDAILQALKSTMYGPDGQPCLPCSGGRYVDGKQKERWYSWVSNAKALGASTLDEFLAYFLSPENGVEISLEGNIEFSMSAKKGAEPELYQSLAPFLVAGSYVDYRGEDGYAWRYKFDGTTMKHVELRLQEVAE